MKVVSAETRVWQPGILLTPRTRSMASMKTALLALLLALTLTGCYDGQRVGQVSIHFELEQDL